MPRHRSTSRRRVPVQPGRFATWLICAAGAMFVLALMSVLLVLRGSDPLLFRAHSLMLPQALQTLGSAMLLGACGATLFASRFKNMLTTQTRQRAYTTLALVSAAGFGCAFLSLTAREWELMLDRTTLVTRAPAVHTDGQHKKGSLLFFTRPVNDRSLAKNLVLNAQHGGRFSALTELENSSDPFISEVLYVTDARLDVRGEQWRLEGVTAPLPPGVQADIHRVSRPEIAEWPGAVRGTLIFNATDVVALQPHGPRKNLVFACYYAIAGAAALATVGLTLLCLILLARHLLHRPVFRAAGNVGVLWAFLSVAWMSCRAML